MGSSCFESVRLLAVESEQRKGSQSTSTMLSARRAPRRSRPTSVIDVLRRS